MIFYQGREIEIKDAKKMFRKKGACSHTLAFLINRELGHEKPMEERALDPLAGGIYAQGYQCGMLWGSSLAAGAESFRRFEDKNKATSMAIRATQDVMESFVKETDNIDCMDITSCDWNNKLSMAKYFITGKFLSCFRLIDRWANEAIRTVLEGLSDKTDEIRQPCVSCASLVAEKMGATEEQQVMVAGFAGGMGLSGNGCGALSAAMWMKTIGWVKDHDGKSAFQNALAVKTYETFQKASDYKMLCKEITGKTFKSLGDHTDYINEGGCKELMDVLVES